MNSRKGFTLIELLVVIAIIGVLSSVILSALNSARTKGNDGSIKANFNTIRTQSFLYLDTNKGYSDGTTVFGLANGTQASCAQVNSIFIDPNVAKAISAADKATGGLGGATPTNVRCSIAASAVGSPSLTWAVSAPLANGTSWWCLDSSNAPKTEAAVLSTPLCP